jgi:hypothetical protein
LDFLRTDITPEIKRLYRPVVEDVNPDHANKGLRVIRAAELVVPELLLYEGPRNKEFNPYYIEITTEELAKKPLLMTAMRARRREAQYFLILGAWQDLEEAEKMVSQVWLRLMPGLYEKR